MNINETLISTALLNSDENEYYKTVELIRSMDEIMNSDTVTGSNKMSVVEVLGDKGYKEMAGIIEEMDLKMFEDFIVNECGDD